MRVNSKIIDSLSALTKEGSFWDIFSSLINDRAFFLILIFRILPGKTMHMI